MRTEAASAGFYTSTLDQVQEKEGERRRQRIHR
jgi:hypothetical protein